MLYVGVLCLIIGAGSGALTGDSTRASRIIRADTGLTSLVVAPTDTPPRRRPRPRVVEVSDWYSRRLTIHRYTAYATIPVFGVQIWAGDQLWRHSAAAPEWAKTMHRVGATTLAGMFAVNTVTGLWNWWDSRTVPQDRALRTVHALSMLAADAAFSYAGGALQQAAQESSAKRREHITVALSATGVTFASALAMKLWNR